MRHSFIMIVAGLLTVLPWGASAFVPETSNATLSLDVLAALALPPGTEREVGVSQALLEWRSVQTPPSAGFAQAALASARSGVGLAAQMGTLREPDSLRGAVEAARTAARHQAEGMGWHVTSPAPPVHDRPSQAIAALLARDGGVDASTLVLASPYDSAPTPLRDALVRVIDTFIAFDDASRSVFEGAEEAAENLPYDSQSAHDVAAALAALDPGSAEAVPVHVGDLPLDFGPVIGAREQLLDAAIRLQDAVQATPPEALAALPALTLFALPAALPAIDPGRQIAATICFDTEANTDWTFDCRLAIDMGGDDNWQNNAGGTGDSVRGCAGAGYIAAALIDLGGNDLYGSEAAPHSCGMNGGGYLGAGFLLDAGGVDTYFGGWDATNGGGELGAGLLLDAGVEGDLYWGGAAGINGGAAGLLLTPVAVGGVTTLRPVVGPAAGLLVDEGGTDNYTAAEWGANGGAWAGTGALVDLGTGSDAYTVREHVDGSLDGFGVNGGVTWDGNSAFTPLFASHGFLFDEGGADHFTGSGWGSNGGGLGGFLWSGGEDDDVYTSVDFGTGGGSGGFLFDGGGSDLYNHGCYGSNGGANGALIHLGGGTDTYLALSSGSCSFPNGEDGLLFDGGGIGDFYQEAYGGPSQTFHDATILPKGRLGLCPPNNFGAPGALIDFPSLAPTMPRDPVSCKPAPCDNPALCELLAKLIA